MRLLLLDYGSNTYALVCHQFAPIFTTFCFTELFCNDISGNMIQPPQPGASPIAKRIPWAEFAKTESYNKTQKTLAEDNYHLVIVPTATTSAVTDVAYIEVSSPAAAPVPPSTGEPNQGEDTLGEQPPPAAA